MAKTKQEVEAEILKFLAEHSSKPRTPSQPIGSNYGTPCTLGTCRDNKPRLTPIDFYNEGLTLWMVGDPGEKITDIRANPNVAIALYGPIDRAKGHTSMRLWGKASLVTYREQKALFLEVLNRYGLFDAFKKVVQSGFIDKIPFIESRPGDDFETKFNRILNMESMIKVEPEKIVLLVSVPGGIGERLEWNK
jgi:hypothetical protein